MDAFGLFALRRAILSAHSVDELAEIANLVPRLYVDLVDAGLEASTLSRIVSTLCDAMTSRLLESSVEQRGAPPVPYAWLALGSTGRNELALASDQDNALAYADTDDPLADAYFLQMATDVVEGLRRCGFPPDAHGVLATHREWRMQRSAWLRAFADCLDGADNERLLRAAIGFDFRHVAGDLSIVPELNEVIRQAPCHSRFLGGLAELGSEISSPLGFRRRLKAPVDIKKDGLLPVQNLARYYAFASGITATNTADRLAAVHQAGGTGSDAARSLRDAFLDMRQLQARHHANGVRAGRTPDNRIDTPNLRPRTKASLQEGLRAVASVQEQLPRRAVL